jgi:hypothetical protein
MSRISIAKARRVLQVALGVVWLLAAALQFQPFMFGRGFALEILKPTAAGNPSFVARPVLWAAHVVLFHPQFWNTIFALTQLLLALGLFWRRSVKLALAGTVVWSLIVWWLGEGLGGVLSGSATPLMGAPGAVILYALLALLLWPRGDEASGGSLAETSILRRVAPLAWLLVWGSEAYFALLPANDSSSALRGMLAGMAGGEPGPIAALDRLLVRLVAHSAAFGPGFGALFALCALAPFVPTRLARPLYALAMALAAITWVGQDFGGIFTGQGTDPNSGPLLFLLALSYWPLRSQPVLAPAHAVKRRPSFMRVGVATAAATLVGASSVAAATGLTTSDASTSTGRAIVSATRTRMLGPSPIHLTYPVAGYEIRFSDTTNRASRPGVMSADITRHGQPVDDTTVSLTFHSLDMHMPDHTFNLRPAGHGRFSAAGPHLSMGGRWRITVTITPPRGPRVRLNLTDLISL